MGTTISYRPVEEFVARLTEGNSLAKTLEDVMHNTLSSVITYVCPVSEGYYNKADLRKHPFFRGLMSKGYSIAITENNTSQFIALAWNLELHDPPITYHLSDVDDNVRAALEEIPTVADVYEAQFRFMDDYLSQIDPHDLPSYEKVQEYGVLTHLLVLPFELVKGVQKHSRVLKKWSDMYPGYKFSIKPIKCDLDVEYNHYLRWKKL